MIFIITALMLEASPIIDHYKLKRDMSIHPFPVFRNNEISLIVSGVGKVKSAMAATFLSSKHNATGNNLLINIGLCGARMGKYPLGSLLIINKVTDLDTGKDYYPDVFVGDGLPNESIFCCSKPVKHNHTQYMDNLFDMESAGIMEAACKFFYAHQVALIKIVSDFLMPENLEKLRLRDYIKCNIPTIEKIINKLGKVNSLSSSISFEEEEKIISIISENIRLSSAMKQILNVEVKKLKRKGLMPLKVLEKHIKNNANTKPEGKKIFEQVIKDIRQDAF
ncbi:MAG TPA: nucleoside phosphorylase [Pseudobacteroides sp.]|uniref:5'-methylthioadenosine/S-adenosylhomocysteine nucleosidase family protein n=1 Tax=Pseudobacteroides sp. TaxID=1968840 RepID=UPI002F92754B